MPNANGEIDHFDIALSIASVAFESMWANVAVALFLGCMILYLLKDFVHKPDDVGDEQLMTPFPAEAEGPPVPDSAEFNDVESDASGAGHLHTRRAVTHVDASRPRRLSRRASMIEPREHRKSRRHSHHRHHHHHHKTAHGGRVDGLGGARELVAELLAAEAPRSGRSSRREILAELLGESQSSRRHSRRRSSHHHHHHRGHGARRHSYSSNSVLRGSGFDAGVATGAAPFHTELSEASVTRDFLSRGSSGTDPTEEDDGAAAFPDAGAASSRQAAASRSSGGGWLEALGSIASLDDDTSDEGEPNEPMPAVAEGDERSTRSSAPGSRGSAAAATSPAGAATAAPTPEAE